MELLEVPHRHRSDARAVQGRGPRDVRHARGSCDVDGVERALPPSRTSRPASSARSASPRSSAPSAARRSVDLGGGRKGLRGAQLVRAVCAGRHAARRSSTVCRPRPRRCMPIPKTSRRLAGEGAEPVASKPEDVRRVRAGRNQEVGRGRQSREHPADRISPCLIPCRRTPAPARLARSRRCGCPRPASSSRTTPARHDGGSAG